MMIGSLILALSVMAPATQALPPAPRCTVVTEAEAVLEDSLVKLSLRPEGEVTRAFLDGEAVAVQGGNLSRRISQSRIVVGYVEGPGGRANCYGRVATIQNRERGRHERFLEIINPARKAGAAERITVLPGQETCGLGNDEHCVVQVVGGVAAVLAPTSVQGWRCSGEIFRSTPMGNVALAEIPLGHDRACEPLFDKS